MTIGYYANFNAINTMCVRVRVYLNEILTIAEAIIKCSYAISASSVAVWEPGLC